MNIPRRIFFIDDCRYTEERVRRWLRSSAATLVAATSVEAAVQVIENFEFDPQKDIVLLDASIEEEGVAPKGRCNTLPLLERIRSRWPDARVFAISDNHQLQGLLLRAEGCVGGCPKSDLTHEVVWNFVAGRFREDINQL